jgi:hypothetical protein
MNTNILKASIAAAGMLMMFAGLASAQEQSDKVKGCSIATLQGSFGCTSTGTLLDSYAVPLGYLTNADKQSVFRPQL